MKNLTKRNKIVLAMAGIVIIAVLAVATFSQVSAGQLFGTVTALVVDPTGNPIPLLIDQSKTVSVHNGDTSCRWTATNPGVVYINASRGAAITSSGVVNYLGASLTVTGRATGTVTFNGTCNTGSATKSVAVAAFAITPNANGLYFGETKTFSTNANDATCTWSTSDSQRLPIQGSNVGASVTVKGIWLNTDYNAQATLSVSCSGRAASRRLTIWSN